MRLATAHHPAQMQQHQNSPAHEEYQWSDWQIVDFPRTDLANQLTSNEVLNCLRQLELGQYRLDLSLTCEQ